MDYYGLFGVPRTASMEEIHRAYQARARLVHPDRHAGAPPDVVAEATRAMAQLNQAWSVLGHPQRRSEYDTTLARHRPGTPPSNPSATMREPEADECVLCGSAPALPATLRSQTGLLVTTRVTRSTGPFCRRCGLAVFRRLTNRTLVTGWWGPVSVFTNWWTVARNILTAEALRPLADPHRRYEHIATPLSRPLDPGATLLRRPGAWLVTAVVAVGLALVLVSPTREPAEPATRTTAGLSEFDGRCLDLTTDGQRIVRAVDCTGTGDARVVAIVPSGERCPRPADSYFVHERSGKRLCVTTRAG